MFDFPPQFLERMQGLFGPSSPEFAAFIASFNLPAASGLRVNTLKLQPVDFAAVSPFTLRPIDWCPEGFLRLESFPIGLTPGKHPFHQAGLYYLQDAAAMAAVSILDPQPGETILDLAAAPGGKSTHIAARLKGKGLLLANEIHPRRAWDLAENLERWGARNAAITNETPERLANHFGAFFDRVVIDAPCSGEGMFRKSTAALQAWSVDLVAGCAQRQVEIIHHAGRLVRPGGYLLYVTCTFAPEEDEAVLAKFLTSPEGSQFKMVKPPLASAFSPGRPDWLLPAPRQELHLENAARLWPQRTRDAAENYADLGMAAGDGHFIALLQRADHAGSDRPKPFKPVVSKESQALFQRFYREVLSDNWPSGSLHQQGQYLYAIPAGLPVMGGLHVIHPGWWLGQFKKDRFEPAHALALGLHFADVSASLHFSPQDAALEAYLRGETLTAPGPDGWTLVGVEAGPDRSFPLGWGRRSNGVLKNFYPRGLRR